MTHKLTIELPDQIYDYLREMAQKSGQSPEQWTVDRLEAITPRAVFLTPAERAAAMADLMRHVGTADLGYPIGVDNEQIDRDLASEAIDPHEEAS